MTAQEWDSQRTSLRECFTLGTITQASRKELEHYLVVLANSSLVEGHTIASAAYKIETEAFVNVITHLLQVRINEELHWRSMVAAGIAILISVLALFATGFQAWNGYRTFHAATSRPALETTQSPVPVVKLPAPSVPLLPAAKVNPPPILSNVSGGTPSGSTNLNSEEPK